MAWRVRLPVALAGLLAALAPVAAQEAGIPPAVLRQALVDALTPALPYPRAGSDGIPESGDAGPAWSVHWPEGDEPRVEVMANPLNAETQARAATAEKEAQAAVMRAQRKSQRDYERALEEFERDRRVSPVREVTLEDEGVAGERFDAESQLLVTLETGSATTTVTIPSSIAPTTGAPMDRGLVIRVAPNTYREQGSSADSPSLRFAPASARIYFGEVAPPLIRRIDGADRFEVAVSANVASAPSAVVVVSGNEALLADVLERADWTKVLALLEP